MTIIILIAFIHIDYNIVVTYYTGVKYEGA